MSARSCFLAKFGQSAAVIAQYSPSGQQNHPKTPGQQPPRHRNKQVVLSKRFIIAPYFTVNLIGIEWQIKVLTC